MDHAPGIGRDPEVPHAPEKITESTELAEVGEYTTQKEYDQLANQQFGSDGEPLHRGTDQDLVYPTQRDYNQLGTEFQPESALERGKDTNPESALEENEENSDKIMTDGGRNLQAEDRFNYDSDADILWGNFVDPNDDTLY